eukprot:CAMPEP_0119011510 /NCGR_PEP_ID=MMETSP1176-20130426/5724_1 /TAXON_ID=265551 /ORGANISM="Synedropsis recta cf, Strain CCMP1620" /LENGTH=1102 /DNA_ID=CAMNT_0006964353 /DNA_START=51 /DNA_END=3359 /DNA_ORIENTATION=+
MGSCFSKEGVVLDGDFFPGTPRDAPKPKTKPTPEEPTRAAPSPAAPPPQKPKPGKPAAAPRPKLEVTPSTRMPTQKAPGTFADHYVEGKPLGYGAFATVFIGKHKQNHKIYAVKKIDRSKMFWGDRDALEDEISNLKLVRDGPHIVKLYEEYYNKQDCFLVMELMDGGELFDRIITKRTFTEREARDVTQCMLEALHYMHSKRVVHRDLKPENLLLPSTKVDTNIKLADFGFAKKVRTQNGCRTLCGTPGYLAPEILERWPAYDTKCDLWSVGVILFLLLGGYLPFEDEDEDKVFDRTRNGYYEFHPHYFGKVSNEAKELVTVLLTVNPSKRASTEKAMAHKWMTRQGDQLQGKQLNADKLKATIMAKEKIRRAVNTVVVANRMKDLNEGFALYLKNRQEEQPKFSMHPNSRKSVMMVDESTSGKPFSQFYEVGELLGQGGFASVHRAENKVSHELFAVKDVNITMLEEAACGALEDEIAALKLLRGGPHIVRLHDVFKEKEHVYMVMEEMKGGELLQRIVDKEVYTEREARQTCMILFEAIDYIHKKRIAHRDIKPENLLLVHADDDTSIKIADFGFAKRVTKKKCLSTLCGTAAYVAPEVLDLKAKGYDERTDMWSIGVVVYILLGGYAPFEGPIEELAVTILRGDYEFHEEYWSHISSEAKDLIASLLKVNPEVRLTAEEALQSDWMIAEEETLTAMDLSTAQEKIKSAMPAEKFRGAVKAIIALDKLTSLGETFTHSLTGTAGSTHLSRTLHGHVLEMSMAQLDEDDLIGLTSVEGSDSGKPFSELYDLGKQLGAGNFSTVYEATHTQSKLGYAVKGVSRKDLHPSDAVALQDEITALNVLKECEFIVTLHDVFEDPDTTYVVLEQMRGGDLIDRIIEKAHYTENDAKGVCKNLLEGVKHCHKRRIANRNLKPENLLLLSKDSDTAVKISDFGYAKKVLYPNSLRTQCGTEGYVAPEILSHKPAYDVKCDMWSLGVILYIVLGGYRPFRGTSDNVMKQIRYGEYEFHARYWSHVSDEAKQLIRRMLTVDPEDRISAEDALKSSWITADLKLGQNELSSGQAKLREAKGKDKMRAVVKLIIATNKLQSLGSKYRAFKDF